MANTAKVLTKGIFPEEAKPAAMLIIFCSAAPQSKNLQGNSSAKRVVMVDLFKSPPSTTMSGFSRPSSNSAFPYASLVETLVVVKVSAQLL